MSSDYGYINARIRGLRKKLLKPEFYNDALNSSDFNAFISQLAQTSYGSELDEAQARYQGIKIVDDAVAHNFYKTSRKILNFADGKPKKLISKVLLQYDLDNMKVIARAKHASRSDEDTLSKLLPAGSLKPVLLETAVSAPDLLSAAQALRVSKSPLKSAFIKAAADYASNANLLALEVALDRAYYEILSETAKKASTPNNFAKFIKREIDANNLRTALSLRYGGAPEGIEVDELFISGGKDVNKEVFKTIANDKSQSAYQALANTAFAEIVDATTLTEAERVVRKVLEKNTRALSSDALNIGLAVNYLRQKENESAKLRLLARGKFYNVDRQSLESELGHA